MYSTNTYTELILVINECTFLLQTQAEPWIRRAASAKFMLVLPPSKDILIFSIWKQSMHLEHLSKGSNFEKLLENASCKLLHVNQCFFLIPLNDRKVVISSIKKLVMELNQKKLKLNSRLKRCFLVYSIQKSYLGQILLKLCGNIYVPVLGQIPDRL